MLRWEYLDSKEAKIFPTAYISGPAISAVGAEVRHCAFVRGRCDSR
jgi:hypothetical protein